MPSNNLRMLMRYGAWADARIYEAVSALPEGVATARRVSGFGNMVNTLQHAYIVDLMWKAHLEGKPHGFTSRVPQTEMPLQQLREAQAEVDRWYVEYADKLSDAKRDEVVHFDFVDGGTGDMSRGDMLLHVVNHKTYHRGHVADMFYQAGARPPVTDLPVFLREQGTA